MTLPCVPFRVDVFTDDFPGETTWELKDKCNNDQVVISRCTFPEENTQYSDEYCVPPGGYEYVIYDSFGDGFCIEDDGTPVCSGNYEVYYDGNLEKSGGNNAFSFESASFGDCPDTVAPSQTFSPTPSPSGTWKPSGDPRPTVCPEPTDAPTLTPSSQPTPPPTPTPSRALIQALFENDCDDCYPAVAMHGDTAVVTRDLIDIRFFSTSNSSFELKTTINLDYDPYLTAVHGNTTVITSRSEDNYTGAMYVYEMAPSTGSWSQVARIQPADIVEGARFGRTVDVDGDVIVVGAPDDGEEYAGSAYVYRRVGGTWSSEAKLTPNDASYSFGSTAYAFGYSVAARGNLIVVGDPDYGEDEVEGEILIYEFDPSSNSWDRVGAVIGDCDYGFGSHVRLTDDGNLLARCGDGRFDDAGSIYYFDRLQVGYALGQIISYPGGAYWTAVSGNTLVVSEYFERGRSNVVHFYVRRSDGTWEEVNVIDDPALDEDFGEDLATTGGGDSLVASERNVYLVRDYTAPPPSGEPTYAPTFVS